MTIKKSSVNLYLFFFKNLDQGDRKIGFTWFEANISTYVLKGEGLRQVNNLLSSKDFCVGYRGKIGRIFYKNINISVHYFMLYCGLVWHSVNKKELPHPQKKTIFEWIRIPSESLVYWYHQQDTTLWHFFFYCSIRKW